MTRTFMIKSKDEYKPGQTVTVWNNMPDKKLQEKYKIVKLLHYNKKDSIGEFKVEPVDVSKDPGNLTDGHGHPSKGLR